MHDPLATEIARRIRTGKYRLTRPDGSAESDIQETWRRVAHTLAAVKPRAREHREKRFYAALTDFKFLPGGRILAGAGSGREVTRFNCLS